MTPEEYFASQLKAIRKEKGINQAELAKAIGVHTGTISHWENGKQLPDTSTMKKIAEYLGVSIGELLSGTGYDTLCCEENSDVNLEELVVQLKTLRKESQQIIASAIRAAYRIEQERAKGVYQPSAKIRINKRCTIVHHPKTGCTAVYQYDICHRIR